VQGELYAVAAYGTGVNHGAPDFLVRKTGKAVTSDNLIELRRLCRVEPQRSDYPLTRFMAQCHRMSRRDGKRLVISYSDPAPP
jgi:hypothetical protein